MKVVLGAGLWNLPHIVILDEPTNFLDRDSLGALATAIKAFQGTLGHNGDATQHINKPILFKSTNNNHHTLF